MRMVPNYGRNEAERFDRIKGKTEQFFRGGNLMKSPTVYVVLGLLLAVAFVGLAGPAQAEMYVEGYLGASQAANLGQNFTVREPHAPPPPPPTPPPTSVPDFHLNYAGRTDVTVIGGVKVGTWFVKEGFLGYSGYPDWCKYLGFYTDFSYQRLFMRNQRLSGTDVYDDGTLASYVVGSIKSEGMAATWAFMFAARYGFLPDSEVPFGRLQPYVAVGPAIMFTSLKPKLNTTNVSTGLPDLQMSPGTQSSTNIALAVDAGIRYMCLKNVSIDISFKYRYAQPSFSFSGLNGANGLVDSFTLHPTFNLFSGQVGVAYHF
jgi:opacity protein-like surface antigen